MRLKNLYEIDFFLLLSTVILMVFGILFIYSSGISSANTLTSNEYIRQIIWAVSGLIIAIIISMLNYRRIYYFCQYIYIVTLILLLYTCIFGKVVNGAKAWIGIGSFGIQPSEFAKLSTIILLAQFLDSTKRTKNDLYRFIISCIIVFIPMFFVLIQPDLGTALVFIPILFVMTFVSGLSLRYIAFLLIIFSLSGLLMVLPLWQTYILKRTIPLLSLITNRHFILLTIAVITAIFFISLFGFIRFRKKYFYWIDYSAIILIISLLISIGIRKIIKEYQIMRLIVFLDPSVDPRGSGWNIIQSITAIGSGGVLGKGYLQGTQSHYQFLPQQSTDFIFSIFSEEWGLAGGILVFILFLNISLRLIKIMGNTSDSFGSYITAGISGMFIFHFLINVGMAMGIMPITGIPLLFMSYGGSSLISAMIGIGIAISVHIRRFRY